MSLRRKTLIFTTVTLVGLILLLYVVLRIIISDGYNTLERNITLRNLSRATNMLTDNVNALGLAVHDWSSWDDTYYFVQDSNASFIDNNLQDVTFRSLDINLMLFVNNANEIVYGKAYDSDTIWQDRLLAAFETYVEREPRFFRVLESNPLAGFLVIDNQPLLLAARSILRSDESGPPVGTLIWAKRIGMQALSSLSQSLQLTVDLRSLTAATTPPDFAQAQAQITPSTNQSVIPLDAQTIAGYTMLSDLYGQPALLLRITQDRSIFWQGQASLNYFALALALVGVVFTVGTLLLLEWIILLPLQNLSLLVHQIGRNDDFSMRLPVTGKNELTELAVAINGMLDALADSRNILYQSNTKLELGVAQRTAELEQQRAQLQAIMDTMGEGLIYSVDNLITFVNRALAELLGYNAADLVGQPFSLLNAQLAPASTPLFQKPLRSHQTTLTRSDGSQIDVALTSTPVDEADKYCRRVIIVRDITQELAAKVQKDYFFARASHDLRSPLTSLMTRLYLLGKRPEQLETHLRALNNVANIMLELLNDLLEVSRLEQGELVLRRRDLVLQTVVEQVVSLLQADAEVKHISLSADMTEQPLRIYGDPLRLNQVVTNLISNALHYTNEGGAISVQVSVDETSGCHCGIICVQDNGIGISEENLAHVFDAFFRVNDERGHGSGLGLHIVKEIVTLHGGDIAVSSKVGQGTTFSIRLPLSSNGHSPLLT